MGSGPHFRPSPKMSRRKQTTSLAGQVVAVNVLLVVATLFAASAAANLNLTIKDQRWSFALLALTIVLVLLVNMIMLRRRDRKSTRLNSSHLGISYAVFCLK